MNRQSTPVSVLLGFAIAMYLLVMAATNWTTDSRNLQYGADSLKWPATTAKITSCQIDIQTQRTKTGSYNTYKCLVQYAYNADGKRFAGDRICYVGIADHYIREREDVQRIADLYACGTFHTVRYNPQAPGECTLNAGIDPDRADLTSLRMGFLCLCMLLVCYLGATSNDPDRNVFAQVAAGIMIVGFLVLAFAMQPTVIRHLVPPSAVVALLR